MKKHLLSGITIIVLVLICAMNGIKLDRWGKNEIIQNDAISYYAYLPAVFIFHDLNFEFTKNLPGNFEGKIWLQKTSDGKPILRMTMGLAILWIPFFLAAHLFAHLSGTPALGYSWPYSLSIFVAALFYLFLGCFFIRRVLSRFFSDRTVAITLILVVLATNLTYYVISEPGMSHVFNFGLISAFLYFTIQWIEKSGMKNSLILGFLAGLILLIRPINILVLIFPAFLGIKSFKDFSGRITGRWNVILLAGLAAFMVLVPQMMYWKAQTGHFIFNSYMDQGKFYFLKPQIINGLFSYRKGWLVYSPVMSLSVIGFIWLKNKAKGLLFPLLLFFTAEIYFIFSWWCWWYGGSFGSRPMIDIYGILAVPMAVCIEKILKGRIWIKGIMTAMLIGLFLFNQFQLRQYQTSLLHWDSMTKKAYWAIMFKQHWPAGYAELIKAPDYDKALKGEKEYP